MFKLLASVAILAAGVAGTANADSSGINVAIPLLHVPLGDSSHASSQASSTSNAFGVLTIINGQTPGPGFGHDVSSAASSNSQGFTQSSGIGGLGGSHGKR